MDRYMPDNLLINIETVALDVRLRRAHFRVMDPRRGPVFGVGIIVAGSLIANAVDSAKPPLSDPPIGLAGLPVYSTVSTLATAPSVTNAITGEEFQGLPVDVRPGSNLRRP